jgi:hypothetical protein
VIVPENKEIFSGYFPCNAAPCGVWVEQEPKICIQVHIVFTLLLCFMFSKVCTYIFFVNLQIANPQVLAHSAVANPEISEVCQSTNYKSANL